MYSKLDYFVYIGNLLGFMGLFGMIIAFITFSYTLLVIFGIIALCAFMVSIFAVTLINYKYRRNIDLIGLAGVLQMEGLDFGRR